MSTPWVFKFYFTALLLVVQLNCWGQNSPELNIQFGHEATITAIKFSSSQNYLLSGDRAGIVKVWDVQSGRVIESTSCLGGKIYDIVPHPTKKKFLVQQEKVVRLQGFSGKTHQTFSRTKKVKTCDFSPEGNLIIIATGSLLSIYDGKNKEPIVTLGKQELKQKTNKTSIGKARFLTNESICFLSAGDLLVWNFLTGNIDLLEQDDHWDFMVEDWPGDWILDFSIDKKNELITLWNNQRWQVINFDNTMLQEGKSKNERILKVDFYGKTSINILEFNDSDNLNQSILRNINLDSSASELFNDKSEIKLLMNVVDCSDKWGILATKGKNKSIDLLSTNDGLELKKLNTAKGIMNLDALSYSSNLNKLYFSSYSTVYITELDLKTGSLTQISLGDCQEKVYVKGEEWMVSSDVEGSYIFISLLNQKNKFSQMELEVPYRHYLTEIEYLNEWDEIVIIGNGDKNDEQDKQSYLYTLSDSEGKAKLEFEWGSGDYSYKSISSEGLILCLKNDEHYVKYFDDEDSLKLIPKINTSGETMFVPGSNDLLILSSDSLFYYENNSNAIDQYVLKWSKKSNRKSSYISAMAIDTLSGSFALGTSDGYVYLYDLQTGLIKVKGKRFHDGLIAELILSGSERRIISTAYDGKISITKWDTKFSKIMDIVPVITDTKSRAGEADAVLMYTPDGYYYTNCTDPSLFHFTVKDKVYTYDQFDVKYNRPDIVFERLNGKNDYSTALSLAHKKRMEKLGIVNDSDVPKGSIPEISIVNRRHIGSLVDDAELTLKIKTSETVHINHQFNVWINGVPIHFEENYKGVNDGESFYLIMVELSSGHNIIEVGLTNNQGYESLRERIEVNCVKNTEKPNLYFVGLGVQEYLDKDRNLKYSTKDVMDLTELLKDKSSKFNKIYIDTFLNSSVLKNCLVDIKKKLANSKINDRVIVYYSGHGLLDKNFDYYLSTFDMNFEDPAGKGMPYSELMSLIEDIPARNKIMFLDACHSGELDKSEVKFESVVVTNESDNSKHFGNKVANKSSSKSFELMKTVFADIRRSTGCSVITSSSGKYVSYEKSDYKNGAFTYALKEALNGESDANNDANLSVSETFKYLVERVPKITDGIQTPTLRIMNTLNDFILW